MKTQNDLLALLRSQFFCNQVAIMAGAGISLNSGMPIVYGNNGLVPSILSHINMLEEDVKLVLSYKLPFEGFMEQIKKAGNFLELLNMFNGGNPSIIHFFLGELYNNSYINTVLTTNFDTLIEKTFENSNIKILHSKDHFESEKWNQNDKFLIKIHGCVSNKKDLAITLSQVANSTLASSREKALKKIFTNKLNHKSVLIIGYSASDIFDISPIIEKLSNKNISIYYISHSLLSSFKVKEISSISNIETGEEILEDGKIIKNPFCSYKGYWVSVNTNSLIKQIWSLLFANSPKDEKYEIDWRSNVDAWNARISEGVKYNLCAAILNEICEYDRGIYYSKMLKESNNAYIDITGRLNNAMFRHRQGDHEFAIREYNYCLNVKSLSQSYYLQTHENLAKALNEVGSYNEAISNGKLAMEGYKLLGDVSAIIRTKRTLANSYIRKGEVNKGLKLAKESYKKALEIGDIKSAAYGRIAASNALSELLKYPESIKQLLEVEKIGLKVDDSYILAMAYNNIGTMYLRSYVYNNGSGDLKKSKIYAIKGYKLAKILGDMHSVNFAQKTLDDINLFANKL